MIYHRHEAKDVPQGELSTRSEFCETSLDSATTYRLLFVALQAWRLCTASLRTIVCSRHTGLLVWSLDIERAVLNCF